MKQYKTSDLALSAYLAAAKFPVREIELSGVNRGVFVHDDEDGVIERFVESYNMGQAQIEPRKYYGELRNLKTRLYQDGVFS